MNWYQKGRSDYLNTIGTGMTKKQCVHELRRKVTRESHPSGTGVLLRESIGDLPAGFDEAAYNQGWSDELSEWNDSQLADELKGARL